MTQQINKNLEVEAAVKDMNLFITINTSHANGLVQVNLDMTDHCTTDFCI